MNLKSRTAIVTGAASGIGRGIAVSLAKRGCNLALADVDEAGLIETERMTASAGAKASRHRLDVSDRQAVAAFPKEILGAHAGVDLVVNNAGVALGGAFEEVAEEDFEWLFGINFWGVVRMTRAFLPLLRASDDARIVNISSVFGLIARSPITRGGRNRQIRTRSPSSWRLPSERSPFRPKGRARSSPRALNGGRSACWSAGTPR